MFAKKAYCYNFITPTHKQHCRVCCFNLPNITNKRNRRAVLRHNSAVSAIVWHEHKVIAALANGSIVSYQKQAAIQQRQSSSMEDEIGDNKRAPPHDAGNWSVIPSKTVQITGKNNEPLHTMVVCANKLWCFATTEAYVVEACKLSVIHSFPLGVGGNSSAAPLQPRQQQRGSTTTTTTTSNYHIAIASGLGVWLSLRNTVTVRLYHAVNYTLMQEVNVTFAVQKILLGFDDILRQHKAACLKVTCLLPCKGCLFIGTSAGIVCSLPLPHITSTTNTKLADVSNTLRALSTFHAGPVRVLTALSQSVQHSTLLPCTAPTSNTSSVTSTKSLNAAQSTHPAIKSQVDRFKERYGDGDNSHQLPPSATSSRRRSSLTLTGTRLLLISGGEGFESVNDDDNKILQRNKAAAKSVGSHSHYHQRSFSATAPKYSIDNNNNRVLLTSERSVIMPLRRSDDSVDDDCLGQEDSNKYLLLWET